MDFLFKIGLFFVPFDNLFFAPSRGWAAISPVIFFLYVLKNFKGLKESFSRLGKLLLFIFFACIYSSLNFFRFTPQLSGISDSISTLLLGITFLLSLDIYFNIKNGERDVVFKILFISYGISITVGIIQYFSFKLGISPVLSVLELFEKRHYDRVAFTFTEPSFISMHLYGIILPLLIFFKAEKSKQYKRFKVLFVIFTVVAILISSSVRLLLDSIFVFTILLISRINFKKVNNFIILILSSSILILGLKYFYDSNLRFRMVVDDGVYSDPSFASRYFRINASLAGYKKDPVSLITGYGISNATYPLVLGYYEALSEYKSPYMSEVIAIYSDRPLQIFCLHIRLISEFGVIIFILILTLMFDKKNKALYLIILYLYLQFDSYAFYALWMYIFFSKYYLLNNKSHAPPELVLNK